MQRAQVFKCLGLFRTNSFQTVPSFRQARLVLLALQLAFGLGVNTATKAVSSSYARHEPEKTILYRIIQENFETFVATAQPRTEKLLFPMHVFREVDAYLGCGILANGFVRLRCDSCKGLWLSLARRGDFVPHVVAEG